MDLSYLKENQDRIRQEFSEELGRYDALRVCREINWLLSKADDNQWVSLEDAYNERVSGKIYSARTISNKKYFFRCICRKLFPDHSFLPRVYKHYESPIDAFLQTEGYSKLNQEYQGLIDTYISLADGANKKPFTIKNHCSLASIFLRYLQSNAVDTLTASTEQVVMSFFYSDSEYEHQIRSYSFKEKLVVVLKTCITDEKYTNGCRHVLNLIPSFRYVRKNVEYLTKSEVEAIRNCLDSERFTPKERAIMMMLLYTGMRSCDVAAVKLCDINWSGETISIVQQKTGEPVDIAMMPAVGNAIFEYLHSKPNGSVYLFCEGEDSEKHISAIHVRNVAYKAYRIAGIRQNNGLRKGTHLFRHYAATKMLENGTPRPVISRTLGHADPESIMPYMHTDFTHLSELALSLEDYPVPEEVWNV